MDLNLNSADCIKKVSNIGSTIFTNICNGTHVIVPWGSSDWIQAIGITFMLGCVGVILIALMFFMHKDMN